MVRVMDVHVDSLAGSQVRNVFFCPQGKQLYFAAIF